LDEERLRRIVEELAFGDMTSQARFLYQPAARGEKPASGAEVVSGLRALPGGRELLELAAGREDVELVGGAVRDLLLGRTPRELDVVVTGDVDSFAEALLARLDGGAEVSAHERFGTACVEWESGRIDIASRRAESYARPGALPDVRAGTPEEDLRRRDFTVNAIAVPLGAADRVGGEPALRAVDHALADLAAGRLRVLHDRSFIDDPTRLLRLARYYARLGFDMNEHTASLAAEAARAGALSTVSGARLGAELRLALSEPSATAALAVLRALDVLPALHPWLRYEAPIVIGALDLLPADGRADLLLLASLLLSSALLCADDPAAEIAAFLDRLEFPAGDRDRVVVAVTAVPQLVEALPATGSPSALRAVTLGLPLEAIALAGGLGEMALLGMSEEMYLAKITAMDADAWLTREKPPATQAARLWLRRLRHVRLEITGDDLLAVGIPEGPEIGSRLAVALDRKLDGELAEGYEAELHAALEAEL
jgi:tRNA nucleotidyltransferase (CCA-adding enzyme)